MYIFPILSIIKKERKYKQQQLLTVGARKLRKPNCFSEVKAEVFPDWSEAEKEGSLF